MQAYRVGSFRFCSRKCNSVWHSKNNKVIKVCEVCGSTHEVPKHRQDIARYCSRPCYYKAMTTKGTVTYTCEVCAVQFLSAPSKDRKYCSARCRGLGSRSHNPGSKNTYRVWFQRRGALVECERCNYNAHPEVLVIHHKDRDRQNNDLSNLEVLCPTCHAVEHYVTK